jgi:hypothetical protein
MKKTLTSLATLAACAAIADSKRQRVPLDLFGINRMVPPHALAYRNPPHAATIARDEGRKADDVRM